MEKLIGERIKEKREESGLTQEELGRFSNSSKQTIWKYETGIITNIPSDKIEMMAKALNVDPAYLMGWTDDNRSNNYTTLAQTKTLKHMSNMNNDGQHQVANYAELLDNSGNYRIIADGQRTYEAAADNGEVTDRDLNTAFEAIKKREDDDKKRTNND